MDHLSPKIKTIPSGRRAAQYMRMSTDQQKYSIELQAAANAAYAARREIEIVRTYTDRGRSGLRIEGRDALREMINDIQFGRADFDCVLVYDISRWGRFQDVDESAYYEFICRRAGIDVHYCAEEFENDGSLASVILKNLKRVKAADFSRQLSNNVFRGQCNVASLGYWRGGPPAYALRRLLLDERDNPKMVLENGQRKNLKTERVILVPGPKREVETVRRIFRLFALKKKSRTEIATELNADRIPNARGRQWTMLTISNTLKNEVYLGHLVYNRRSMKLGERQVKNSPDLWIRRDNAFKAIISPELFKKAQKRMKELANGREETDRRLLDRLAKLKQKEGRLSLNLIRATDTVPDASVYAHRFGSLTAAYEKVGFTLPTRYRYTETAARIAAVISAVADDMIAALGSASVNTTFLQELNLLTVANSLTVVIAVARSVSDGDIRARRWEVRKIKYRKADILLLVRMNKDNTRIKDYFLLPTADVPLAKDGRKIRVSDRVFGQSRLTSFGDTVKALQARLRVSIGNNREAVPVGGVIGRATSRATPAKPRQAKPVQSTTRSREKIVRARR